MPSAHARIGPSSFARVIRCPGSVRETDGLPDSANEFSAEGSVLHTIAEDCLLLGLEPEDFLGQTMSHDGFSFKIGTGEGETDPSCMIPALDWIRQQPGELWIEIRVNLDRWLPGQFGTCDVMIWDVETGVLTVFDWKFGRGEMVETEGNEQAQGYALGAVAKLQEERGVTPDTVRIIIEQPRGQGGQRFYEPWEISYEQLLAFGDDVLKPMWTAANDPNAPLCAGRKQCKFCDAKNRPPKPGDLSGCKAYDAFNLEMAQLALDELDDLADLRLEPELPTDMTPARRWWIVSHADMFKKWLAQLHEDSMEAAEAGRPDPGSKLVIGRRGDRAWPQDEIERLIVEYWLIESLGEDAFTRTLKGPAGIEKLAATRKGKKAYPGLWDALEQVIEQGEGKPILVSEHDARPALSNRLDELEDLD